MTCDEVRERLGSLQDGELEPAERAGVEAHLASCEPCRAARAELARQHEALARAFEPLRAQGPALAERVNARLRAEPTSAAPASLAPASLAPASPAATPAPAAPAVLPWLRTVLAACAGFLLAALLFHERPPEPVVPVASPTPAASLAPVVVVAKLGPSTGALEWRAAGEPDWRPCPTGASLAAGTCVRTHEGTKAALECEDGSEVRLNGETEVQLATARRVGLRRGEVMTRVAHDPVRFLVETDVTRVEALGTTLDVAHAPGSPRGGGAVTTVSVVEGVALVGSVTVEGGFQCQVVDGTVGQPVRARELLVLTKWVNELLALKGGEDEEFQKRVNGMLALIGESKMAYLDESEIRSLGDHCAVPLTRYIESSESATNLARRRNAARILSDVASKESVADLAALLSDPDPEVRVQMARGLERLTGTSLGYGEEQWRATANAQGVQAWRDYLGRRESPWRTTPRGRGKD